MSAHTTTVKYGLSNCLCRQRNELPRLMSGEIAV